MISLRLTACFALACATLLIHTQAHAAGSATLDAIRARGSVICAMQPDNVPFSQPDSQGVWRGLDVDSCRALAAATLGDASKFTIRPITGLTRFPTLQGGEADVLFGSTTWITTRETSLGLVFAGANYYSGQGFIVRSALGVTSAKDLNGATICVPPGSTTEVLLEDYFRKIGGSFRPVIIDDVNQIIASFLSGRCDAYTRDVTGLSGFRSRQPHPEAFVVLPEIISMEPLGAFVRKGDDAWLDIVRWTQFALLAAEQLDVTSANADMRAAGTDPEVRRLLGTEGGVGLSMGLDPLWAARAIKAVGNYGEMWERDVAPIGLPRGLNRLWDKGGLMFSPPLR
jgi:general L-amino acid transport system substrate-binding protein